MTDWLAETGDESELRAAVRGWIERHVPADWLDAALRGDLDSLHRVRSPAAYRDWYPTLGRSGLIGAGWPREYGGLGLSGPLLAVVSAELRRARLTTLNIVGVALVAPTLLEWGTADQCRRFLSAIADNTEVWCQLFSEPGAGSDLAGLSTRAVPAGAAWTVNGQKVWSSFAAEAHHGILLARTDPDVPKHAGITAFAFPLRQPGVTVRPLRKISGESDFNEVFLDDAVVDDGNRIGAVGEGWRVARAVLGHERRMLAGAGSAMRQRTSGSSFQRLVQLTGRGEPGHRPVDDPLVRDRVVRLYIEGQVLVATNERARVMGGASRAAAVLKVMSSEHNQRLQAAMVDMLGYAGTACRPGDEEAQRITYGYLRSRGDTIAGGTSEVQRNNIAERTLGLPKDPSSDVSLPWRDIPRGR
jgi:alkylation response protein AidB-like acyl-CoA dehydrogenase